MAQDVKPYVPLHVHTHYSVQDGLSTPAELVEKCQRYGMPACAVTDHGTLFGQMPFAQAAKGKIKAIFGCELYVAPDRVDNRQAKSSHEAAEHLVAYVRNETGYRNLCKLATKACLHGWHYKPRVDDNLLAEHSEGLMASSACLSGRIPRRLLGNRPEDARREAAKYAEIFGRENFFIELMNHGMDEEEQITDELYRISRELKLMTIATNDSHYTNREDARTHDILLCIQTQKTLNDENRMRLPNDEFYLRTPEEMWSWFMRWPDALENTLAVAERCDFVMPENQHLIPNYDLPDGVDHFEYLQKLTMEGLAWRMGDNPPREYLERLEYELGVIRQMNFVDYFLVVWDMIHFVRQHAIPVGPGRGSGAGSLVAYCLGITGVDPLKYGLYFERFLNPERKSMPDIDTDFCYRSRKEVVRYLRERYGEMNVAQITAFQSMKARNAFRCVARAMGIPFSETNELLKLIPELPGKKLESLAQIQEADPVGLNRVMEANSQFAEVFREAIKLEGAINAVSTHAAGVVICDHDLTDHVALYRPADGHGSETQVQMDMGGVDKFGLLKIDVLGLRTLTVIWDTVKLLRQHRGIEIDINKIDLNDRAAYRLIQEGNVKGVFQMESAGMRETARQAGVGSIEELSAVIAMYRPGPMALIPKYMENKFNQDRIVYDPPHTEDILKETYGVAIYQEQVMGLVRACAGFSAGKADNIRRAMSKKKAGELAALKTEFIKGCQQNGIPEDKAEELWERIYAFAGYGFNKSHSLAYAIVAYQTAYLKAHYPVEFMCALLTSEIGKQEKLEEYILEARNMGIEVLPPDINASTEIFSIESGKIRYALTAIQNMGEKAAEAIVAEREKNGPYRDVFDFCIRLSDTRLSSIVIQRLNHAGAFLSTGWSIRQVDEVTEMALREGQLRSREKNSGQFLLFEDAETT
ncbi:MAG TPA: DNA polymerase III subunit alpha, partial [Candidatus Hydrogenedentes bacterium]|nr:DNA polymerase III subunit alpha [Candidatus Hydrogenedentota bacterium]